MTLNSEKQLRKVNSCFRSVLEENFFPSVFLTFFESTDARDLGLMTLLDFQSLTARLYTPLH